jgi:hypothetical protein
LLLSYPNTFHNSFYYHIFILFKYSFQINVRRKDKKRTKNKIKLVIALVAFKRIPIMFLEKDMLFA